MKKDQRKEMPDDWKLIGEEIEEEGDKSSKEEEITDLTEEDLPTIVFEGEKIDIKDVMNQNIVIRDVVTRPSSFTEGDYAVLQIEKDGEPCTITTGSTVLMRQIKERADKLPFRCQIVEQHSLKSGYSYYTLAPAVKKMKDF
jgi:hypothetical protein